MTETTAQLIERKVTAALAPEHLDIVDDSHLHAGHAGARGGGGHFTLTVVSQVFEGLSPLRRHRLVYSALADEVGSAIHALALRTVTPEEWRDR